MNQILNDLKKIEVSTLEKPERIILNKNNRLSKKKNNIKYRNQKTSKKQNIISGFNNDKLQKYKNERIKERYLLRKKRKQRKKENNSFKKQKKNKNISKKITFCMGNNKVKEYVCTGLEEYKQTTNFNDGYTSDYESEPFEIKEMPEINLDELFN